MVSSKEDEEDLTMKSNWVRHCELISAYCGVRYVSESAIWYFEDGFGYCELITGESYSCNNWEEFQLICAE